MSQLQASQLTDTLADALLGNGERIYQWLSKHYAPLHALKSLSTYADSASLIIYIADCCDISPGLAEGILHKAIEAADTFDQGAFLQRHMAQYWSELSPADFQAINGLRSNLASYLQLRYSLPRAAAWSQVHSFFAQVFRH